MTAKTKTEREQAIATLRKMLPVGKLVYTTLNHVSRSGMQRRIRCHVVRKGGIEDISCLVKTALGESMDDRGIKVDGCGMDMGFHLVYSLGHALRPNGFKVKGTGRNGDTSGHDSDGGYSLEQRWM